MNMRLSSVELRPVDLAEPEVATLYLECLEAEKRLRGARKVAAAAVFQVREKQLNELWKRLSEIDPQLCDALQEGVRDWHEVAVKLRGGE
ncbi:hypothetical protein [Paraburkholderia phenazinium]|jgi:hypothetical protein|uniref:Uncharacterized protein n=1 Tax=Paraburkholderia phenazinium TaxID=60549 RepID=A0A1G8IDJ7_9BURK|nr:hypothetical protein [Paraburkholderia phenazinium]SDI16841.1 hypothetical protein SAMN05216466_11854 [Paraburkholderia phenazinium]